MEQPRINPVTEPTDEQAELLGKMQLRAGERPLNIFGTLAHHPRLLKRFSLLGSAFLMDGRLPAREREVVILRIGWRCRSPYEFGQHRRLGREAGLTDAEIARCADADTSEGEWSAGDAALVALADDMCDTDTVSDATWSALADRWDDAELIELVLLAGYYRMVSGFLNAVGVQLDPGVEGLPT